MQVTLYHQSRYLCLLDKYSQACHPFSSKVQGCGEPGPRHVLLTRDGQIANDVVSDHESTEMCMDSILFVFSRK